MVSLILSNPPEPGDFTLDINPVLLEDDALFECQVGAAEGVGPIRSSVARLTVRVPPEPPVIVNGAVLRTTEATTVNIECVSRGGKPPSDVSLYIFWYLKICLRVLFLFLLYFSLIY